MNNDNQNEKARPINDNRSEEVKTAEKLQGRYKSINEIREAFLKETITEPQDIEKIKEQGKIGVLKIANEGLVYKLLERCKLYKGKIAQLEKANNDKDETIDLLLKRLQEHEPNLFKELSDETIKRKQEQKEIKTCECEEAECIKGEICQELAKEDNKE
jgi:hypothetical protein